MTLYGTHRGTAALAAACALWAAAAMPIAAQGGGAPARLALLPVENLTSDAPDVERFRAGLREALLAKGLSTVHPGVVDDGLARRRVRFVGGLDDATALRLREVGGVGAFLAISFELYDASENPRIAVTARLMQVEDDGVRPVRASSYHLAGDDSPGLLGRQRVLDIAVLERRVRDALAGDVASWLAGPRGPGPNEGPRKGQRRFEPRSLFLAQGSTPFPAGARKVVVLPFRNQSANPHAGEILALEIAHELIQEGRFSVVERGVVRKALLDLRIIQEGGISLAQADVLRALLDADAVITGTVSDWRDGRTGSPALVDFNGYMVDTRTKKVAWLSRSRAEGTDGASLFGLREVRTAPALGRELVRGLLEAVASKLRKESRAPSR